MLEFNIFNSAQIFDQIFAFICVYLLTSLNAKTRFYGFIIGTVGFIPGVYLLIATQLWWLSSSIRIFTSKCVLCGVFDLELSLLCFWVSILLDCACLQVLKTGGRNIERVSRDEVLFDHI